MDPSEQVNKKNVRLQKQVYGSIKIVVSNNKVFILKPTHPEFPGFRTAPTWLLRWAADWPWG